MQRLRALGVPKALLSVSALVEGNHDTIIATLGYLMCFFPSLAYTPRMAVPGQSAGAAVAGKS